MVATPAPFDRAALEALYTRLERPLYNVVYRRLWHREDAMDVVQETFVRLWRARGRVRVETVESMTWRIALNLASNRRRSRRLWGWVPFVVERDERGSGPSAEAALATAQREAAVRRAVDELPEKLRDVMLLCEFSGLSHGEVAATLDIPVGTVASRRHLAAARLRGELEGA